jgi:hypothetical protein
MAPPKMGMMGMGGSKVVEEQDEFIKMASSEL